MKHRLFAPLLAVALSLTGCATLNSPRTCERALSGLTAAQDILAALRAAGVQSDTAAKIAAALTLGQIGVGAACATIPASHA